jgi:hypothetical protein
MVNPAAAVLLALLVVATPTTDTYTTAENPAGVPVEWIVPDGVTSVSIVAAGGNGGSFVPFRPGGRGAVITTTLDVTPGQSLSIVLGADGLQSGTGGLGYGTGGAGINGAGGGGSTAVLLDGEAVLVAGAGGGSGASAKDGGGGGGGTPAGFAGSRNSGVGGAEGTGGAGIAPWGGPGGTGLLASGGSVGNADGAGGGAGWGGGGAGGVLGDGAGGGSYPSTLDAASYSLRTDTDVDGWVTLDYELPEPEPTASPTPVAERPAGVDAGLLGVGAVGILGLGVVLIIVTAIVRARRRSA